MLVTVGENHFRVSFSHDIQQPQPATLVIDDTEQEVLLAPDHRSRTYCFIDRVNPEPEAVAAEAVVAESPELSDFVKSLPPEDGVLYVSAVSECSECDVFSKAVGRKLSLARALDDGGFTREERILFWEAYKKSGAKFI